MRLANVSGRATIVTGAGGIDVASASGGRAGPDVQALYEDWDAFEALAAELAHGRRRPDRRRPRRRGRPAVTGPRAAAGVRHRAQLPLPRRGDRQGHAVRAGHVHQVPGEPRRALRRGDAVGRHRRLGGRARGRDRPPRRPGRRGRRVAPRRRPHGRAGPLRPHAAVRGGRPVRPGQVAPRLWPSRPVAGHARRAARPRRPGPRLPGERRDGAGGPHRRHGLQRAPTRRRAVGRRVPAARRRDLHRHAGRRRHRRQPPRFLRPGDVLESWIEGIGTIRNRLVAAS